MKYKRHNEILKIVRENSISTHDELIDELKKRGINVTQATVSRDIKALRLLKVPSPNGSAYAVSDEKGDNNSGLFSNSIISIQSALHTVVVRTYPGTAGAVAASVDGVLGDEMLGSIAGDDTLLVIAEDEEKAKGLCERIKNLFDYKEDK